MSRLIFVYNNVMGVIQGGMASFGKDTNLFDLAKNIFTD
jgi:hypothetical protein